MHTPVNSISNVIRILLDGLEGPLSDGQRKSIEMVDRSVRNLSEMINDLLDLAKVEAGKIAVRPHEFDIADVLASLNSLFKPMLSNNSSVHLTFDEPTEKLILFSDEGKISQILRNLIGNALKFTERGEVRVSVEKNSRGFLRILVTDTGIGIDSKDLEHIFDEFVQIDSPTQKKNKGTGLGLPLTRKLATLLGGRVYVESKLGLGSTFIVELPFSHTGPLEGTYISKPRTNSLGIRKNILIIDDDASDRSGLRAILSEEIDCEITEAHDGQAGLRVARQNPTHLILVDLVMPEMSGLDVLRALREMKETQDTPVIIHSSQSVSIEDLDTFAGLDARFLSKYRSDFEKLEVIRQSLFPARINPVKENEDVHRNI